MSFRTFGVRTNVSWCITRVETAPVFYMGCNSWLHILTHFFACTLRPGLQPSRMYVRFIADHHKMNEKELTSSELTIVNDSAPKALPSLLSAKL
jgi:hypothetical protein